MTKGNRTRRKYPKAVRALASGICAKRKSMGISQYELADSTGLTRNCIQQMECYEHLPRIESVFDMMLGLDFNEEEGKELLWNCLTGYRKDKSDQKSQEKDWQVTYDGYL